MTVSQAQGLSLQTSLRQLIEGYRVSQLLYVVAELGIADLLKEGPQSYSELAQESSTHPQSLFRVMRGLASIGVFTQLDEERFALNEMSEPLVSDAPHSLRPAARMVGSQFYPAWSKVMHTVRTGETAFDTLFGKTVWEYREQNPEAGQLFNSLMSTSSAVRMDIVAASLDWSRFATIVDVGGGQGTLLATILQANPNGRGIVYDLAGPTCAASVRLAELGLSDRCEVVPGSFMDSVPAGADAYVLSRILHDWQDEEALQILRNCRAAMQVDTTLVLVERVLDELASTPEHTFGDLTMMVMNGGRERTETEFRKLLEATGFRLVQIVLTEMSFQLLEAVAV